ncbi:MAG: hypothetical protein KAT57_01355, partial [Candidatus Lokiarchaeota archaeon]|nr:hypothetical protein [Candidatus Lokiarchaeota archaeon]
KAPVPVSPLKLMEQKHRISPTPPKTPEMPKKTLIPIENDIPKKPVTPVEPITSSKINGQQQKTPLIEVKQKDDMKKSLLELRIKKANLTKMSLDLDMQELTGEITSEELQEKKIKINELIQRIDQQILELQKLLNY